MCVVCVCVHRYSISVVYVCVYCNVNDNLDVCMLR